MIIETTDNRLYRVRDAGPGLEHVWAGLEVKRVRILGEIAYPTKTTARETLVRKAGARVVQEVV